MGAIRAALVDAVIAALPVALVYFSGWAYLTSYLGYFGLDATQIDVSFTTVLVYAFIPLQAVWVLLLIGLTVVVGFAAYLVESYPEETKFRHRAGAAALGAIAMLCTVVLLFVIKSAATASAKSMVDKVWMGSKSHTVMSLNEGQKGNAVNLYNACSAKYRLRQIIGLPNQMILLCRSDLRPCDQGTVFSISNDGRIIFTANKIRSDIHEQKLCSN